MGGAQSSYFEETDWTLANGSLTSPEQTLDGAPPTASYQCYELIKRSIVANQREFHVTDAQKNLLFQIRPSPGTIAGFDVLGAGSAQKDDFILRVTVDLARRTWIIYRFQKPVFEGQLPDPVATEKFALEQQQQQVLANSSDRKELAARISASLQVHSFSDDRPVDESEFAVKEKPIPTHFLYKVGCVTVSWSRYMAVAAYYGPPTIEQIMAATEKAAALAREMTLQATKSQEEEEQDAADILVEAARIAGRLREQRVEGVDPELPPDAVIDRDKKGVDPELPPDAMIDQDPHDPPEPLSLTDLPVREDAVTAEAPCAEHYEPQVISAVGNEASTMEANSVPTAVLSEENNFVVPHRSLADDLVDESESSVDAEIVKEDPLLLHPDNLQSNDSLEILTSASMPELSHNNNISPSAHSKLQKWWKESSRTLQEKSMSMLRSSGIADDADGVDSSSHSDRGVGTFLGLSKSIVAADDPLQGVIHLDKPLLLCQEIYTRIIGNHQTSKVSKEKVLSLLRQDMEQHLQNKKENEKVDDVNELSDVAAAVSADSSKSEDNKGKLSEEHGPQDPSMACKTNDDEVIQDATTPVESNVESPAQKEQPLVGYWVWENTLRTHKMKMHLAKGSDLALHVVLAVLVNQMRYERNAIAIAV